MKVYGPYLGKDGRRRVDVYDLPEGKKRTIQYAKYLIEQKLGRKLTSDENVDHIDRDKSNDDLDNLQIVAKVDHAKLDARRVKQVEIECVLCHTKTLKSSRQIRHNSKLGKAGPFCGRICAGKYGVEIQNHRISKLPVQPGSKSAYYYNTKVPESEG